MKDLRIEKLAKVLVHHSCKVKDGDAVMIEFKGVQTLELAKALVKEITEAGGVPFWFYNGQELSRQFFHYASEGQFAKFGQIHRQLMEKMDCYIGIRGDDNPFDLSDLSSDRQKFLSQHIWKSVHIEVRLKKRWVVLRYPTPSMSMQAQMPTEEFEDFYFKVCTLDYSKMERALQPLKELMEKTDRVRIVGPGTDLSFSIKGMNAIICAGELNIPDGEIFTAPVKDSINGTVRFNTTTLYKSTRFSNVSLEFKEGKIVKAHSDENVDKLGEILNTDEGARYIGEFAIGVNPYIQKPMMDILFDEKINGSFHMAIGNAYDEADNGNKSSIHWDLVCIQRPEWGGGEIYFDDVLIRKDGRFVLKELEPLNPENLE